MKLESLFVSGHRLFTLVSDGEELTLRHETFDNLDQCHLPQSYQPDMVIPPDRVNNIDVSNNGRNMIIITVVESGEPLISCKSNDEWTYFFIDIEPKLLIHVQPKNADHVFDEYVHKSSEYEALNHFTKNVLDGGKENYDKFMQEMMGEIEKINKEVEAM